MRFVLAVLALAGAVSAQAVTALITPTSPAPAGCTGTKSGTFQLSIVSVANPHGTKAKRQDSDGQLLLTLNNGILKDSNGRTGYVASNEQFHFDGPPQAGAIYTGGFSICQNGSIALGGSAIWYSCSSGSKFDNLYEMNVGQLNCSEVYFYAANSGSTSGSEYPAPATSASSAASSAAASPTTMMASSATMASSASSAVAPAPTVAQGGAASIVVDTVVALVGAAGLVALL